MRNVFFEPIYQALLDISQHRAFFDREVTLTRLAQKALDTQNGRKMYLQLVEIGFKTGRYESEKAMIEIARKTLKELLLSKEFKDFISAD